MNNSRRAFFKKKVNGSSLLTNLVAYWPFDTNYDDIIASRTPFYNSGTSISTPAVNGSSLLFVGGDSNRIQYAHDADFTFSDGTNDLPFSISCWVKFGSYSSTFNTILCKRDFNVNTGNQLHIRRDSSTGRIRVLIMDAETVQNLSAEVTDFTTDLINFFHLVVTYDGSGSHLGVNVYINGALRSMSRSNGGYLKMRIRASPITLMSFTFTTTSNFQNPGRLDELAIWKNRELTAEEILTIYNSGLGNPYPF